MNGGHHTAAQESLFLSQAGYGGSKVLADVFKLAALADEVARYAPLRLNGTSVLVEGYSDPGEFPIALADSGVQFDSVNDWPFLVQISYQEEMCQSSLFLCQYQSNYLYFQYADLSPYFRTNLSTKDKDDVVLSEDRHPGALSQDLVLLSSACSESVTAPAHFHCSRFVHALSGDDSSQPAVKLQK